MIEVEAKFQAKSPQILDQIRSRKQVAGYTLSDWQSTPQRDTYLDTTTGLLARNGTALRIRQKIRAPGTTVEGEAVVTFKAQTEDMYTYTELEMPINDQEVQTLLGGNLEKVRVEAVEAAVRYLNGEVVLPVLHVENLRETWHLNAEAGRIEVCLDEVRYTDKNRIQSIQEYGVELELKTGEPAFLQQVADALSQQYDLIPIFQSKYERGIIHLNVFNVKTEN